MVTLVTPLVKPERPPMTLEEKSETLLTTDAAKAEPGMVGIETVWLPEPDSDGGVMLDVGTVPETIGLATAGS